MDLSLTLNITPEDMPFEAEMPAGRASLNRNSTARSPGR